MTRRRGKAQRSHRATNRRRLWLLAGFALIAYTSLAARAVQLQAVDADWLAQRAERQHTSKVRIEPLRGEIRDRNGVLMAGSAEVLSVAASPHRIVDTDRTVQQLARVLELDHRAIARRLAPRRSFSWVQRWVTPEQAERVRTLNLPGIHLHPERKRFFPSRQLAGAFLGFAGRDGHGLSGVELAFDARLSGNSSELPALRDARGRRLIDVAATPSARSGNQITLALDTQLQHRAELELRNALKRTGAQHASLLALDPRSGELLAVAEAPGFDPNQFWRADASRYRSRAIVDAFEPGSTLKPFTVALALEQGSVSPKEPFDCENGLWHVADRRIRDWKPYGILSVHDIVRNSSNIGAAKIAERLGSTRLVDGLRAFGFGERPGTGYPGEAPGLVHTLREKQVVERANLAFGQGLLVSALQLARATAVIANGGFAVQPTLLRTGETSTGERVISGQSARTVLQMMRSVVDGGTGSSAALPHHAAAGKTGTAQKAVGGGYSQKLFIASFVGVVPVQDPELVVVIVIDEPEHGRHTGGFAAAPVFREFAKFAVQRLGIPMGDPV